MFLLLLKPQMGAAAGWEGPERAASCARRLACWLGLALCERQTAVGVWPRQWLAVGTMLAEHPGYHTVMEDKRMDGLHSGPVEPVYGGIDRRG